VIDQTAILQAIGAPAENTRPFCGSFLMCGTPLETKAGTAGLEKPDLEKAKALLKESGYDGRPVIFKVDIQPVEIGHMRGGSPMYWGGPSKVHPEIS
jgi:hypothetical protein